MDIEININDIQFTFPVDLQFYQFKIEGQHQYSDCIDAVLERLKLIELVHQIKIDKFELKLEEQVPYLIDSLESIGDSTFVELLKGTKDMTSKHMKCRQKDCISFWLLNWAVCDIESNAVTQWLYDGELYLFKLRALLLDDQDLADFISINKIQCEIIEEASVKKLWRNDLQLYGKLSDFQMYVVPREKVRHLVRERLVLHRNEKVLLSSSLFRSELHNYYSDILKIHYMESVAFVKSEAAKAFSIKKINKVVKKQLYALSNINAQLKLFKSSDSDDDMMCHLDNSNIDKIANDLFPPCMQKLHERLREKHHLKYHNRLQLTTFLKNLGMTLDNLVLYLQNEFTKKMTDEKFNQGYLYNVKHAYGLVGKKQSYPSRACKFLAVDPNAFGESKCCSFVDDIEDIHKKMFRENIPMSKIHAIKCCAANGDYGSACSKYFAAKYQCEEPGPMEYPLNYVELSRQARNNPAPSKSSTPIQSIDVSLEMLQLNSGLKTEPEAVDIEVITLS